jgi:hypothetical protein
MSKPKPSKPAKPTTVSEPAAVTELVFESEVSQGHEPTIVTATTPTPNEVAMRERFAQSVSTEIEASALMPGIECPFTQDCNGKVRILTENTVPQTLDDGRTIVHRVQQFHCQKCKCVAKGVKPIGGPAVGGPRLFNRITGRSE